MLPIIGLGSLQSIMDLKLLSGIDVSILQTDVLDYVRQGKLALGIESWLIYNSKWSNEESI